MPRLKVQLLALLAWWWQATVQGLRWPASDAQRLDVVAWTLRMVIIGLHLNYAVNPVVRPNTPLLLPSFAAFDDAIPYQAFGWASIFIALLLVYLPPRVPLGLISTGLSCFFLYFIGAMFWQGVGLIPGSVVYPFFGAISGGLFVRAIWLWAKQNTWFQRHVMAHGARLADSRSEHHHGR